MAAPTVIHRPWIRCAEPERLAPGHHGLDTLARCLLAGAAGVVLFASFSPRESWWLAPVAFALLGPVLHGRHARVGFGYGLLFGLGFYLPLLSWTGEFVGSLPWLALATLESLVAALAGAGIALVSRLRAAPLWATGVWVAAEALIARVPFGGFPWGRVAFSQPEGLFLPIVALGGTPLLGAAVVLTGLAVGELARRALGESSHRVLTGTYRSRQLTVPALLAVVPVLVALAATPLVGTAAEAGKVTVALVQGDVPRAGLDFNAQRRAVLDNHVARTEELAADVAAGRAPRPELVIWPENSSDIDPLRNADGAQAIDRAARAIRVPILVGAVLHSGGDRSTNTMIVWDPVTGPGEEHDKRRVQPFGEYVPYRDFFRRFSPLVDRASNFVPGAGDGVVNLGGVPVGIATCYEVVFDDLVRQSVRAGAQFIAVPTNNATFGRTDMTYQQQAMSRVRAVEHGRAVVIAATSGSSAVIAPDGTVEQHTDLFVPAVLVAEVPLRTTTTLATRLGAGPEWMLVTLAVAAVFAAAVTRGRDDAQTAVRTAASAGGTARDAAAGTANVTGHGMGSTLVVVPTYDERDNLGPVLRRLHAAVPAAHVLVVDDASPDGTGQLADELAATDDRICVLHRSTKGGLGTAYTAGFRWALERGYDVIVEMDADGSHAPEELPRLLTTLVRDGADVTMGSRYVAGGRVVNWPRHRKWLSRAGNLYSQIALGVTVADMTSGFRAYRRHVLAVLPLGEVASQGYCFQVDIAWRAVRAGFRVVEVPITFTERERGSSKMSGRIVREALWRVTRWGLRHRLRQLAGRGLRPNVSDGRGAR